MAATLSHTLEDQVMCPICLGQYEDPRILPCLHTYCRKCLQELLDKGNRRFSIKCPECSEIFQVENVTSLRVNIWINKDLELLELYKAEGGQKSEAKLMCNNDTCNSKGQAEARCFDCEIFMCASCIKAHQVMSKFTKDHHLMTLEEIEKKGVPLMEKPTMCEKHKGEKQKLYCKQCETLICRDCTLIDHKDHKYAFIADVVEEHKGKLQQKLQDACGAKKEIVSALKTVKSMKGRVKKNEEIVKKEIDENINAKIAILEEMRTKLKQEATNLTAMKMKNLSLQQDGLEMHLAGLTSAVEFTENILAKGSNNDVLSMKKQVESRLTDLSNKEIDDVVEEYEQVLQVNEIPNFFDDIMNYLVIKDRFAPDPKKCSVGWIEGTDDIRLQVRNYLGEPIDIKTNRIQIKCPYILECSKNLGKTGECLIKAKWFNRQKRANIDKTTDGRNQAKVLVDGLSVRGSPLEVEKVTSLKNNSWVNKDLELLELSKAESQKSEATVMCSNDTCKGQAEARCSDCEIFMCASCIQAHQVSEHRPKYSHSRHRSLSSESSGSSPALEYEYGANIRLNTPFTSDSSVGVRDHSKPFLPISSGDVRLGKRVVVMRSCGNVGRGVVRYVGALPKRQGSYIGVELDNPDGKHDGSFNGEQFFKCEPNKGVFVKFDKVIMCYN